MFSPLNFLIYFCKRTNLPYFIGILTVIKMALMSVSMYIYLRFRCEYDFLWFYGLAVAYAFSPCSLIYYFLQFLLDAAILLPLLMLGYRAIIERRDNRLYFIIYSICCSLNIYVTVMISIFIIIYTGIVFGVLRKDENKVVIVRDVFFSSLLGLGFSSFAWVPAVDCIIKSARFDSTRNNLLSTYLSAVTNEDWAFYIKGFMVIGSIPLIILIILSFIYKFIRHKYEKKIIATNKTEIIAGLLLIAMVVSVFIPGVELLWTMGTRIAYPVRFMFIVSFVLVDTICILVLSNKIYDTKLVKIAFILLVIVIAFFNSYKWIRLDGLDYSRSEYIIKANEIYERNIPNDVFIKYREGSGEMHENYGLISKTNSIGQYAHIVPRDIADTYAKYGYTKYAHKTNEIGGTIFSDLVLGVKGVIKDYEVEDYDYSMPPVFFVDNDIEFNGNIFDFQNSVNHILGSDDGNLLIERFRISPNVNTTIRVDGKKWMYLYLKDINENTYLDQNRLTIYVNDSAVKTKSWGDHDYNGFPQYLNNGLLFLGSFCDESIELLARTINDAVELEVGLLDEEVLRNCIKSVNDKNQIDSVQEGLRSIELKVQSADAISEGYLFIPIVYDNRWKCLLNGKRVELESIMGGFIGVPVLSSSNHVLLKYEPISQKIGYLITMVSILLVIVIYHISPIKKVLWGASELNGKILKIENNLYTFLFVIFTVLFFVIPLGHFVWMRIIKLCGIIGLI